MFILTVVVLLQSSLKLQNNKVTTKILSHNALPTKQIGPKYVVLILQISRCCSLSWCCNMGRWEWYKAGDEWTSVLW